MILQYTNSKYSVPRDDDDDGHDYHDGHERYLPHFVLTFFVGLQEKLGDFAVRREHLKGLFGKREAFHHDAKQPHRIEFWL